jgi:LPXTG-motif cell wall-anchored protein
MRMATALAAVGALVMSGGVVMLAASPAAVAGNETKTAICHRTASDTNPYVFEEPDDNALDAHFNNLPGHPAKYWKSDGIWRGVPHKASDAKNDYRASGPADCQGENDHPTVIEELPTVEVQDPCGTTNDKVILSVSADDEYTGVDNHDGTATFTAEPGFVFPEGKHTYVVEYTMPTNVPCDTTVTIDPPAAPSTTDPCGPANIYFNVPADTAQLDYTLLANGNVTVAPKPGFKFSGASQLITFTLPADSGVPCPLAAEEIEPVVTFTDPTCQALDGADWSGTYDSIVKYEVTGKVDLGETVVVTASIRPSYVGEYAFPDGFDATFEHTYPTLAELDCVLGEETVVPTPKPEVKPPVVLGTEAAVPTGVSAGLSGLPNAGSTSNNLLAQLMVGGGLLLLVAGGWLGFGRREYGGHQL